MDGKDSFMSRLLGNAEKFSTEQVAQTIQLLVEHGVRWQASDIHIEPHDQYVLVRYRIDGHLKGAHKITRNALEALLAQLKLMAHLDATEEHNPQQGSFSITVDDQSYEIKLSTMPVYGGQKAVLHLAPQVREPIPLKSIGYWGSSLKSLQIALTRNHGMIIVSAPKHHGRPTTEASMLAALNNPGLNITTVEDAIEYRIPHASQTVVNPRHDLTFKKGLEATLHQDPNVILLSNLPDRATADAAVHVGMSGHLVVAGMHSDAAASALLHLRAIGVQPYLIASTVRTVVSQRLMRKLCEHCRERYELTEDQLTLLQRVFGISTNSAFQRIHQLEKLAIEAGIGGTSEPSSTATNIIYLWRPHREGCEACNHTGYTGRAIIGEVMNVTDAVQQALLSPNTTVSTLQQTALKENFVPLAIDGLVKALRGVVTIKDVLRSVDRSLRISA